MPRARSSKRSSLPAEAADSPLTWSAPTNITGTRYLTSVSCPSAAFCMAVDTIDAYTWNGASWSAGTIEMAWCRCASNFVPAGGLISTTYALSGGDSPASRT